MVRTRPRPRAALRRLRPGRAGLTELRAVRESLLSVAALVGRPVYNRFDGEIGRLVDVVVRLTGEDDYPPVTGLVVKVGRRTAYISGAQIDTIDHDHVKLRSAKVALEDFQRRPGEVTLTRDVLDHQLVDVDGVQVIRASDLYLALVATGYRLVGAETGFGALARRLGPAGWRHRPVPRRMLDWSQIEPFGTPQSQVRLREAREDLRRLRPSDVADLLEDLTGSARQDLLDALDPDVAADALEEMDPEELEALLRDQAPERAAQLLAEMEPDEAADALRTMGVEESRRMLSLMEPGAAAELRTLLGYDADTAGGIMTTSVVVAERDETVAALQQRLRTHDEHADVIDAVAVVDSEGRLVDDVTLFALLCARRETTLRELATDEGPSPVHIDASVPELADAFVDARRSSLVVVDADGRPVGRILADDIVDALLPGRGRFHFPRMFE